MCKDLKLIVNTVTMLEQSMQVFQKSCQEVMEKALQSMQKKIDELAQKLIEYMPQPTLQPFSPPQAQVYNVMQPATLFHSVPPASSHHMNESPMGQSAPKSYCCIKHEVQRNVSHGDFQRETQDNCRNFAKV